MLYVSEWFHKYLTHRTGGKINFADLDNYKVKSLDGNSDFLILQETFNKPTIPSYVGFIDLKGFSEYSHLKTGEEIYQFVNPFIEYILNTLKRENCYIDKTIGDEVMFIIPDGGEKTIIPAILTIEQILGSFAYDVRNKSCNYKFRIGISYGDLFFTQISNNRYKEWTVFGEAIHVAKRLMSIEDLRDPKNVLCGFGINYAHRFVNPIYFASYNQNWEKSPVKEICNLKGVGKVVYIVLEPNKS